MKSCRWRWSREQQPITNAFLRACTPLPRASPITTRTNCHAAKAFEEQREAGFENFYPMTLGEVIKDKYRVVAKLGFGSASTIWCCQNISTKTYSALKIYAHNLIAEDELDNETAIYEHISNSGHSDHPGKAFVRIIQDSFVCKSRAGNLHKCLVHEVLSNDILTLRYHSRDRHLPEATLKQFLMHLLIAVDYLHRVCQVIHTDIKEENILLGLADPSILEQLDTEEMAQSSLYNTINGYNLYRSVNFGIPARFGRPILCDFSLARDGRVKHNHDIQPDPYRAPEVILEVPWGYAADIWNVGVMIWDMLENKRMFDVLDPSDNQYKNRFHLASIVGLLGPPPLDFLQKSAFSAVYFDEKGKWKCVNPVRPKTWDDMVRNVQILDKKGFVDFMRKMITWDPESRATAEDLLQDEWLLSPSD